MLMRCRWLAEKKIVCPEHMLGFDSEAAVADILRHARPLASQRLRLRRFAAEHIILRTTAERREELRLVVDLLAQTFSALERGKNFGRTPSAGRHQGYPPGELQLDLAP